MVPKLAIGALALSPLLAACGGANVAAVRPPVVPIYACPSSGRLTEARETQNREGCFDAGRLIGMRLKDAERLAAAHGFTVRRAAPLEPGEVLTDDYVPSRIDVEGNEASEDAIVVRLMYRG